MLWFNHFPFSSVVRGAWMLLLVLCLSLRASGAAAAPTFAEQIDALKAGGYLELPSVQACIEAAEELAQKPIWARSYSEEDMRKGVVDGKRYIEAIAKMDSLRNRRPHLAETFGLATSDISGCRNIMSEVPLMAAVYRLTGSEAVKRRLIAQLEEVATWSPFQRPGWTASAMKEETLPADGDGVWLATGTLIQAICITLDILPEDTLPVALKDRLLGALERELRLIESDWKTAKPWYVKQGKAESNQWIVPASGLVIASTYLGREKFPEAYEVGVKALEQSLALTGADGSMSEGYTYAFSWSSGSLLLANRFMQINGDERLAEHPFLANFPRWASLCYQPGGYVVNAFDGYGATRDTGVSSFQAHLCQTAAITNDEGLYWLLGHVGGGASTDVFGLLALGGIERADTPPPTSGLFEKSRMFIWRSSWEPDASGLWVRGGDPGDFHDHWDRGHVNFIARGKAVLIEAGTPGYADPRKRPEFDSVIGHNVLQVGDAVTPNKGPAQIEVLENTDNGGRLTVQAAASYPGVESWLRDVQWAGDRVVVKDAVSTVDHIPQKLLLRWNLGTSEDAVIEGSGTRYTVSIPEGRQVFPVSRRLRAQSGGAAPREDVVETPQIRLELESSVPVTVTQVMRRNHLFKFRRPNHLHTSIEVTPVDAVAEWTLQTRVVAKSADSALAQRVE